MDGDTGQDPPSIGFAVLLVAAPIVAGVLLFVFFETGPIHRLGLYLIGAGVLVGGILVLWRRT